MASRYMELTAYIRTLDPFAEDDQSEWDEVNAEMEQIAAEAWAEEEEARAIAESEAAAVQQWLHRFDDGREQFMGLAEYD